ncbi:lipoate--protein ligase family protein [Salibacterium aidingense]|uniref:lipoate--protein ligase family protein n=1 Tax=Salibacterium aidingense TaxID=384933 RepID=UPI003BD7CAC2
MNRKDMLNGQTWRWVDHSSSGLHFHPLQSFAFDDTFCVSTGRGASPVMRAWVHSPTIVLGIQDSRLPYAAEGVRFLENQGYQVIVRNSGGLAVVLDEDIFNLSFIFQEDKKFSIHSGYDFMWEIARLLFADAPGPVEAFEVKGSYCPGDYDLSINGKKFAGISQRRIRGGVAVQLYMAARGSGSERASLLKDFYEHAVQEEPTKFWWPRITPQTMASLSEIYGKTIAVNHILYRLLTTVKAEGADIQPSELSPDELEHFDIFFQRVTERNDKALFRTMEEQNQE